MSNAGSVESDCANFDKPGAYEVMQAFDDLPFELRVRLCNAVLDWDSRSVLLAWKEKKISIGAILADIERKERAILSASR